MSFLFEWVPEDKLTSDQARELLSPHCERLRSTWCDAWSSWNSEVTSDGRGRLTTRSRSSCVNDFAVERAKEMFAGIDGVECCPILGFFKLYVENKAVLRFKRLNRDKLAMNVKTEQQVAYYQDEHIPGIRAGCTRLTIGYMLNLTETEIEDILVTYQLGRQRSSLRWWFSILGDADTLGLPATVAPDPSPSPIRIQPKVAKAKDGTGA